MKLSGSGLKKATFDDADLKKNNLISADSEV